MAAAVSATVNVCPPSDRWLPSAASVTACAPSIVASPDRISLGVIPAQSCAAAASNPLAVSCTVIAVANATPPAFPLSVNAAKLSSIAT